MTKKEYKNPHAYIGFLVWKLHNIMSNAMADAYHVPGKLSFSHMMVLSSLYWHTESGRDINQKDLARYMCMKKITTSVILRKLHTLALISFSENAGDKRAKIVKITKKGELLIVGFLDVATMLESKISTKSPNLLQGLSDLMEELSYRHR